MHPLHWWFALLLLTPGLFLIACGQQQSESGPDVVGIWEVVGPYSAEEITTTFEEDGDVTIASKSTKSVTMRYRIETIEAWHKRRAKEIGQTQGDVGNLFDGISHVVIAFPPESPDEFIPSHNFFYNPTADSLSVSGVAELRRKR